jgi:hypothetical protein
MIPTSSPRPRKILLILFGIFLLGGLAFTQGMILHPYFQSRAAREWKETPCRIISSEVKSHRDSDATTYSVEISYAYKIGGREFRSNRYQLPRFFSSGRQAKAATVARFPRGKATVCFVNPRNPADAVLDRGFASIGWFALLPLAFIGVGAAGIVGVVRGRKDAPLLNGDAPDAEIPWQTRPDWAAGRIVSSAKKTLGFAWLFAVAWNAIAFPVAVMVLSQNVIRKGNYGPAFALVFPVIGVAILFWALRETLRWFRYGESVFEMASVPGVIGGALEGVIRLSRPIRPEGPVRLRLNALSRTTTGAGDSSSTSEALLWQREETVEMDGGDAIPAAFLIPDDASPTTVIGSGNGILWRLEARARVPGMDYAAQFEVPVFPGELSPEQRAKTERLTARQQIEIAAYVPPPNSPIRVQTALSGGTEFSFPARRNLGVSILPTVVLLVILGLLGAAIQCHWPLPFTLFFSLIGFLLTLGVLHAWTASTRVVVQKEGVTVTSTFLGIARTRTVAAAEIDAIKPEIGMMLGSNVYQDLHILCRDGKSVTAGKSIADTRQAQWLADQMIRALRKN